MHYRLNMSEYDTIEDALSSIPSETESLDLSGNDLGDYIENGDLIRLFKGIPETVKALDLSDNHLNEDAGNAGNVWKEEELVLVFKALPCGITSLDLSENGLGCDEFAEIMDAIPGHVHSITLFGNYLGEMDASYLIAAFKNIKPSVRYIDLTDNRLNLYESDELAKVFKAIPENVLHIDVSHNHLILLETEDNGRQIRSLEELKEIFSGVNEGTTIGFSGESLSVLEGGCEANDALLRLLTEAADGRHLDLSDTGLVLNHMTEEANDSLPQSTDDLSVFNQGGASSTGSGDPNKRKHISDEDPGDDENADNNKALKARHL